MMKTFDAGKCTIVTPTQFGDLTDLMLTTATAYELITLYPVEFGKDDNSIGDSPIIIQNDREFSVLADWEGNVLTQGF